MLPTITLPLPVRYVLSLLAGLASVLNQTTFWAHPSSSPWATFLTVALAFLAALGILPVAGAAFQALLAKLIPAKWLVPVHALIVAGVAAAEVALTRNGWSTAAHGVVAGVVAVLLGLGFGPPIAAIVAKARGVKA